MPTPRRVGGVQLSLDVQRTMPAPFQTGRIPWPAPPMSRRWSPTRASSRWSARRRRRSPRRRSRSRTRPGFSQCSPANTNPGLTKPRDGALDLRSAFPTRINYIRTAPSDDIQGPALASFVFHGPRREVDPRDRRRRQGRQIADEFSAAYTKLGGTVVRRALNPGDKPAFRPRSAVGLQRRARRRCSSAGSPRPEPPTSGRRWWQPVRLPSRS